MSFIKKTIFGTFRDPWGALIGLLFYEKDSCTLFHRSSTKTLTRRTQQDLEVGIGNGTL